MSISQNFPAISPTLNLNFARSKKLDPRIAFTRSSSATRTNAQGLVETVSTNIPRFDHSYNSSTGSVNSLGLLIEESRTNLITYSEQFDNAAWAKINAGITTNTSATTAPDGSNNAEKLVENAGAGTKQLYQGGISQTLGTPITYTFFAKAAERTFVFFGSGSSMSFGISGYFNLSTGAAVSNGSATATVSTVSYPNGWYRCSITATPTVTTSGALFDLRPSINGIDSGSYTGDGTSGIYLWGAQVETGAFPTSYIPTVASTVTRSTDYAIISGTNFSNFYNQTEGTLFAAARINALGGNNYPGIVYVDDGTIDNCIGILVNDVSGDLISAEAYVSNINQYYLSTGATTVTPNQLNKVITAYKVNDFAAAFSITNTVGTDTSGSVPTVNRMLIGLLRGSNAPLNGTVAQILYYPRRLTNTQLQNLTK